MPLDIDAHRHDIDDTIRFLKGRIPSAQLYELGAILLSSGSFLIASAIPELKNQLIPATNLAHQLLTQEDNHAAPEPASD